MTPPHQDGRDRFKDQVLLLVCGIACAFIAWLFFAGLGDWAPTILLCVVLFAQTAKIRQLKNEVRRLQQRYEPDAKPPL